MPLVENLESLRCSATRLRKMKEALDEPNVDFFALISKQDLKKNFDYFIKVLDHVLQDERKQVYFLLDRTRTYLCLYCFFVSYYFLYVC